MYSVIGFSRLLQRTRKTFNLITSNRKSKMYFKRIKASFIRGRVARRYHTSLKNSYMVSSVTNSARPYSTTANICSSWTKRDLNLKRTPKRGEFQLLKF